MGIESLGTQVIDTETLVTQMRRAGNQLEADVLESDVRNRGQRAIADITAFALSDLVKPAVPADPNQGNLFSNQGTLFE